MVFIKSNYFFILILIFLGISCNETAKKDTARQQHKIYKSENLFLPDDLEVSLWAESPMLNNPTNMDVDVKGRIWVTEAVNYREFNNKGAGFLRRKQGDRILILTDTNNDGKADSCKVFTEDPDLIAPVGIAVIGSKIIVSCSPNLIVFTDENGDDVPDKKEILLTGFGGKDHDHSLHAVYAGPDGNWYFNVGNAGPHIVKDKSGWTLRAGSIYTGGSPYNTKNQGNMVSDDGQVWVGGLALRINPDGRNLKVMAHNFRNSYEIIPDSYGNLWQNDNDDQVVSCRTTWLMEGGNAGYFSSDGTRNWQADQRPGQEVFTAHWHQDDPGVMPAGDCSGAGAPTGVTVIEGDELGEEYQGMMLSADAGRNIIFGYHPQIKSSGYDMGKRENLISSITDNNERYVWNDTSLKKQKEKWFRPSDVTVGTEGAIYVADWYDPIVGGHRMQDSAAYGRIYRITKKSSRMTVPKIELNTIEGQISALKSPAINVRNAGFMKLKEQGEKNVEAVSALLKETNPYVKARAIWLLSQLGAAGQKKVEQLLSDDDEMMRATAYRALRQVVPDILPYATKMMSDKSAFVRREVANSIKDLPYNLKKDILLLLIKSFDGNDRWYLETIGAALKGHESEIYPEIKKIFDGNDALRWNKQMEMLAWRLHPAEAVKDLSLRANSSSLDTSKRQLALTALGFVNNKAAALEMAHLAHSPLTDVAQTARFWLGFRQGNDWANYIEWSNININTAYERKLSEMKVRMQMLLDHHQSDYERKTEASEMAKDSIGGQMLIGLAAENKLPADLKLFIAERIFNNPDATIRAQAGNYFKDSSAEKTYSVPHITSLTSDPVKGEKLFGTRCATCHKFGDKGNSIGPDLTSISGKFNDKELLEAVIDPSASIVFGYEPWLVNTRDNESVFGFLISQNEGSLTVRDIAGNNHIIKKKDVLSSRKQDKSLMPSAAQNKLSEQDLSDIVSFLKKAK